MSSSKSRDRFFVRHTRTLLRGFLRSDDGMLIRRIVRENLGNQWKGYGLAIAMTVVAAACTSLSAYMIGKIVNATYVDRSFALVATWSAVLILLFVLKGLSTYGQNITTARVGNRLTAETQKRIFDRLLRQGMPFLADRHSTEFMANTVVAAGSIATVMNTLVLALSRDLLSLIGLVCLMIWQDPHLSLISLAVMPLALVGVQRLQVRARRIAASQFSGAASMLGTMQETVQGFRVVKAFNLEDAVRQRVAANIESLERASNKMARVSNRSTPMLEALAGLAIGLTCLYGGYRILLTNAAPGEFVSFITACILAFEPARRIARVNVELSGSLVVARNLFRLFDAPLTEVDETGKAPLAITKGGIEFADVTFGYRPNVPILRVLSFVAEPGKVTALVGPSGGGKSTVFNLLLRFYDDRQGRIMIEGQDIGSTSRQSLRQQIAYVGQDIYLFRGTIRENILIGKPSATTDELIDAARAAFAHDFIMGCAQGYDTPVGESGMTLSLGQRQRISLARALIRNAPIVLLDEPTAALDSESEHHVQTAIRRLCAGKTTLAIAHRLNTIRDADCIHVLEGGRVVESGTHERLIEENGRYATFFRLQFPQEQLLKSGHS